MAKVLVENDNLNDIFDLGRRFPLATNVMVRVAAKSGADLVELMAGFPEHMTPRRIETYLKEQMASEAPSDDNSDDNSTGKAKGPSNKAAGAKTATKSTTKQASKTVSKSKSKTEMDEEPDEMVDEKVDGGRPEDPVSTPNSISYEGMKAPELFKLCKERGLKPKARQKADYYVDLLMELDEASDESVDEDDDWDI
jgi:hypothetical protein